MEEDNAEYTRIVNFVNYAGMKELEIFIPLLDETQNYYYDYKQVIHDILDIENIGLRNKLRNMCYGKMRTHYANETVCKIVNAGEFDDKEKELLYTLHSVIVEKEYPDRWTIIQNTSFYLNGNQFSYEYYNTGDKYKNILEIDETKLNFRHLFEWEADHLGTYETFFNHNSEKFMNAINNDVVRYAKNANMTLDEYVKFIVKLMDIIASGDCLARYIGCSVEKYVGKDIKYNKYDFEEERIVELHE